MGSGHANQLTFNELLPITTATLVLFSHKKGWKITTFSLMWSYKMLHRQGQFRKCRCSTIIGLYIKAGYRLKAGQFEPVDPSLPARKPIKNRTSHKILILRGVQKCVSSTKRFFLKCRLTQPHSKRY